MKDIPPIKAVMTPFPQSIEAGAPLPHARSMMAEHKISHLPVTRDGKLFAIVTDRDLGAATDSSGGNQPKTEPRVRDVCRTEPYIVDLTDPLDHVLAQMADRGLDCALVVKDGRLAGIFTATDACRQFSEFLQRLFPREDSDGVA